MAIDPNVLEEMDTIRVELVGGPGSGKTYNLMQVMARYVSEGKKVIVVDLSEKSALKQLKMIAREWAKDNPEWLKLVDYVKCSDYPEYLGATYTDAAAMIVDAFHHTQMMIRHWARENLLKQGFYYEGKKKITIENPDTFTLQGWMYDLANTREDGLMKRLISGDFDLYAGLDPTKKHSDVSGLFDSVIELTAESSGPPEKRWKWRIEKWRGKARTSYDWQSTSPHADVVQLASGSGVD